MFTRTELELSEVPQLKTLCLRYGLRPTGNPGYKDSYIVTWMAFPLLAINQMEENRGLRRPSFGSYQNLGQALDEMNEPTPEQAALIRISFEGRRIEYP